MSINNEGAVAPNSIEAQALNELQKEGHDISTSKPDANDGEIKDVPSVEEKKEVIEPKKEETPKEEIKPSRTPTMVEAWKLKVAEDQKEAALKAKSELEAKIEEMSKQNNPVTQTQKDDIEAEIKALAGDKDVDVEFLSKFANNILSKAKPSVDVEKTIKDLTEKNQLSEQLNQYSNEFENDVLPLVKEYQLSDKQLSDLKSTLRNIAFSDTYAKVPLKEIFEIKKSTFDISQPKKSSEGKSIKTRGNDFVDVDSIDEDSFKNLKPEQVDEFISKKSSGSGWKVPRK